MKAGADCSVWSRSKLRAAAGRAGPSNA